MIVPSYKHPASISRSPAFANGRLKGVYTGTCAFVGPTRKGPVGASAEPLTSFPDFERLYGGVEDLAFDASALHNRNYVAHAARTFFENGGTRLYVSRAASADAAVAHARHTPVVAALAPRTGGAAGRQDPRSGQHR
jgi:hypothetical protein